MSAGPGHQPVLREEVLQALQLRPAGAYVDATYGRGGHAAAILAQLGPDGRLVAMDRDPEAIASARIALAGDPRVCVRHARFSRIGAEVAGCGLGAVDGIVMDLGVSSPQLDDAARGFSFRQDGPLDMRMEPDAGESAAAWLARAPEADITSVLSTLGEERFARRIARAIVARRATRPLTHTGDLAALVAAVVPTRTPGRHPATRSFQAIRMHVNHELEELEAALPECLRVLRPGGRLAVISFHSLEDRLVKHFVRDEAGHAPRERPDLPPPVTVRARLRAVGRSIIAGEAEVARNPRARSARLRVAERLPDHA